MKDVFVNYSCYNCGERFEQAASKKVGTKDVWCRSSLFPVSWFLQSVLVQWNGSIARFSKLQSHYSEIPPNVEISIRKSEEKTGNHSNAGLSHSLQNSPIVTVFSAEEKRSVN